MEIKPIHNNILVKQDKEQDIKQGNIIISNVGNEKPLIGTILDVGEGIYSTSGNFIPLNPRFQKGVKVFYSPFGGSRISYGGEEYIICKETDILAILEKTEEK
jgi:chaperonin GroES